MSKFIHSTSETDIGLKRQANEDNYGTQSTVNGEVFIVCDGMGGHVGGATASKIAVDSIIQYLTSEYYENIVIALDKAVEFANAQVYGEAQSNPDLKGMGTTCTVLVIRDYKIYIAHVGDSRIYIQNDGKLKRLTKDHSFVQGLVDKGIIKDSEAEDHPRKNELLQALGVRPEVEVTVAQEAIVPKKGDKFMLCSDGLCGLVNDTDMNQVIQRSAYLETAAKDLIDLAKAAGGHDNITVQLIEVLESPSLESTFVDLSPSEAAPSVINANRTTAIEDRRGQSSQNKKSSRSKPVLIGVVSLLITGLSIGGFFFFMNSGVDDKAKQEEVTTGGLEGGEDTTSNIKGDSYVDIDYSYRVVIDLKKDSTDKGKCKLYDSNGKLIGPITPEDFTFSWSKLARVLGNTIKEAKKGNSLCSEACYKLSAHGSYQPLCEYFRNNGNKKSLEGIDEIFVTEAAWADENQKSCCIKERSTVVIERRTSGDGTSTSGSTKTTSGSTTTTTSDGTTTTSSSTTTNNDDGTTTTSSSTTTNNDDGTTTTSSSTTTNNDDGTTTTSSSTTTNNGDGTKTTSSSTTTNNGDGTTTSGSSATNNDDGTTTTTITDDRGNDNLEVTPKDNGTETKPKSPDGIDK